MSELEIIKLFTVEHPNSPCWNGSPSIELHNNKQSFS